MFEETAPANPEGIVYVLTNEAMPGLVKIGRTSGETVERRVAELSRATGVPLPFRVAVARRVHDAAKVERALHVAFGRQRVNPSREFFTAEAFRLVELVNAFPGTDLTPETEAAVEREIEKVEPGAYAAERSFEQKKRRPPLNFEEMGIVIGSVLTHTRTGETAEVVEPKKVVFRGEVMSLTRAQQVVTSAPYAVQPGRHWTTDGGRTISDHYEETYPLHEETEAF
ncbi:GIY-YIG nuclease family protein [Brevundimonas sp.]|uniref:GIY-YIG nuclease family protein n=1 Tax=Brevundimonas sp. TaxID=1871086 RepID=UPI0026219EBD|nr:GIY-YIG nuclease family protein [Brevundimonas sp.]